MPGRLCEEFFRGSHVNHVDGEVGQFGAEGGGQVVAAAFYKHHIGIGKLSNMRSMASKLMEASSRMAV